MKNKETEIFLGGKHLNIQSANYVQTYNSLQLITPDDGAIELNVEIKADFSKIPEKYHEVFLNMFSSKYVGRVSFGDNPFSQCQPTPKRKWYQFWKSKTLNI
jgi:hypothetical protein